MSKVEELFIQALELNEDEFEELFELLARRIPPPQIHESWLQLARERSASLKAGATTAIPWAEVRESMFRRVNGG